MTRTKRRQPVVFGLVLALTTATHAGAVFSQTPSPSGGILQSSWLTPDGSNWDIFLWDDFTLATDETITEITWRGGYYANGAYSNSVDKFTVEIWRSSGGLFQPDILFGPLVHYTVNGNAGETPAGTAGGTAMYDYHYTLPAPFQAAANTRYWLRIYAWQHSVPEWGFSRAVETGHHFRYVEGSHMYQVITGNTAFTLYGADLPAHTITANPSPSDAGTVQGAGAYPDGATAALRAIPASGWGFDRWTENGSTVSRSNPYTFAVTRDRDLTAEFLPLVSISTAPGPIYGGTAIGGGDYNSGDTVTVIAEPDPHFTFVNWTDFGTPVSDTAVYTFTATTNRSLVANFVLTPNSRAFDFDSGPVHVAFPIEYVSDGLAAFFDDSGWTYSIQPANTLGFTPLGFTGYCIYPGTGFPSDIIVDFSAPLTSFSIQFCPQEIGCDDSATLRATGYLNGALVATDTARVPQPGTYPTGTLRLDSTRPFDRVVVHYDATPPTCQDYGRIFLADNVLVTIAAPPDTGPGGAEQPGPIKNSPSAPHVRRSGRL